MTANKSIKVELYYDHADGSTLSDSRGTVASTVRKVDDTLVTVYRADSGATVSTANLNSGVLYKMEIPSEVLTYFAGQTNPEARVYLKVITTIYSTSSNSSYSGRMH